MKNIAFISLGCDKNRVDSERMIYSVLRGDYSLSSTEDADIIVVNTCAFILSAINESIDTILHIAENYKKNGKCEKLIVTGCINQRFKEQIKSLLPEVDAFVPIEENANILSIINNLYGKDNTLTKLDNKRVLTTYPHVAYLRIADGCNNYCTFCTIPSIRGKYVSENLESIVDEARSLADDGVKEIILIAQDVTRYGFDITGKSELIPLLKKLCEIPSVKYRLMYCYPEQISDELLQFIADNDSIIKYLDVPIQHVSDNILKLMNRRDTCDNIKRLFAKMNALNITVRTTLMVGFPGETENDFKQLCDFVKEYKPLYTGIFAYSKEDGTPAARLKNQIPNRVKTERVETLGSIAANVSSAYNKSLVGKTLSVIYEDIDYDKNLFIGRTLFQAPDVDGVVYFRTGESLEVGNYYDIKITGCDDYDLYGESIK